MTSRTTDPTAGPPAPRRVAQAMPGEPAAPSPRAAGGKTPSGTARAAAPSVPDGHSPGVPCGERPAGQYAGKPGRASVFGCSSVEARPGSNAIAAAMSEDRGPDSLDAHVRKLMKDLGLLAYHTRDSRRSAKGYPDWTVAGPGGVMWRELKTQRGKPTREQQAWLDTLAMFGGDADVWRPEDLLSGRIARELAALAGLRGVA